MKVRKVGVAGIAVAMALSLTSCGDDEAPTSKPVDEAAAVGQVGSDSTALSVAEFRQQIADAKIRGVSGHVDATVDFLGQAGSLSGDFALGRDAKDSAADLSADLGGRNAAVRLVDGRLYLKGLGLGTDPSRPWVRIDLSKSGAAESPASMLDAVKPERLMEYLDAVSSIEDLGKEKVDGVQAHHYSVTVDTAVLAEGNDDGDRGESGFALPDTITGEVWLNSDNLPVKVLVALDGAGSLEAHFSDYGSEVKVVAPPTRLVSTFGR